MKRIALVNSGRDRQPSTESLRSLRPNQKLNPEDCPACRSSLDFLGCPFCWGSGSETRPPATLSAA